MFTGQLRAKDWALNDCLVKATENCPAACDDLCRVVVVLASNGLTHDLAKLNRTDKSSQDQGMGQIEYNASVAEVI